MNPCSPSSAVPPQQLRSAQHPVAVPPPIAAARQCNGVQDQPTPRSGRHPRARGNRAGAEPGPPSAGYMTSATPRRRADPAAAPPGPLPAPDHHRASISIDKQTLQDFEQPARQPFDCVSAQGVVRPGPAPLDVDETRLAQHLQMMGDRGLLDLEDLLELAHTERFVLSEEADHLQPDLVAQGGEPRRLLSDLSLIEAGAGDRRHATVIAAPPL